ncbi:MAG: outer rane lipoprotein carrier protein LolA, partial [Solirubrobacteraceae bacterium]|nr:outer rane lipoprotein carrier protein LolA [Solirubrobacteraceae bacterium]
KKPAAGAALGRRHSDHGPSVSLPTIDVNGASGQVLPTALGTFVSFTRGGVRYEVAGSVRQPVAEAAARGL